MPPESIRAVIDVGTNSVKLLVGACTGNAVAPLLERSEQTRLGEGFFAEKRLTPDAIRRTAEAVDRFRTEADRFNPESLRVVATAAAREAINRSELESSLAEAAGQPIEIISGDTEAELAFRGVCTLPHLDGLPLLVTDVGGGSTEFIVGTAGRREFSRSFPLGAVRLFESTRPGPEPTSDDLLRCRRQVTDFLRNSVCPHLPLLHPPPSDANAESNRRRFVGVGGTVVILARMAHAMADYDRARIESTRLDAAAIRALTERLWSLPLAERRQVPGLPPERADIILTGIVIYEAILDVLGFDAVFPSTRGLRFAALLAPA